MRRTLLLCVGLLASQGAMARADIFFTQNFVADFEFSLPPGSPLNSGSTTVGPIPFEAVGSLTIGVDNALNDPSMPTSVAITSFSGNLIGVAPSNFLPYSIDPNVSFVGGSLTNIVRDGSGQVTSADVTGLSAYWEMFAPGIRLYGDTPLVFDGPITGLPFTPGDIIAGPDPFNVYLDTGKGPGGGDPLFAIGQNRTLRAVPEPASLALFGIGASSLLGLARRNRKRAEAARQVAR